MKKKSALKLFTHQFLFPMKTAIKPKFNRNKLYELVCGAFQLYPTNSSLTKFISQVHALEPLVH